MSEKEGSLTYCKKNKSREQQRKHIEQPSSGKKRNADIQTRSPKFPKLSSKPVVLDNPSKWEIQKLRVESK